MDEGWDVSMINCSADGRHLYAAISEDLSDRFRVDYLRGYVGFRQTWEARPLSRIIKVAIDGAGGEPIFEERYWIGHVNTSPTRSDLLTFCHEGPWNEVDNRSWGMNADSGEGCKLYQCCHRPPSRRLLELASEFEPSSRDIFEVVLTPTIHCVRPNDPGRTDRQLVT